MDIQYLIWLQDLRGLLGPVVEEFFIILSKVGASTALALVPLVIYWCFDKRKGLLIIFNFSSSYYANQLIKNTFCAYRPWIRDSRVIPSEKALTGATGYSFPSGHTIVAGSTLGMAGWLYRQKSRVAQVILWIIVALVMFSRNYLGVHTPQDVVAALGVVILSAVITGRIFSWFDRHQDQDLKILIIATVVTILSILYIVLKPYPMDYVEGQLVVDPIEMSKDTLMAIGLLFGSAMGWFLERRFIGFTTSNGSVKRNALRIVIGIMGLLVTIILHKTALKLIPVIWVHYFIYGFLLTFMGVYVTPLVFNWIEKK